MADTSSETPSKRMRKSTADVSGEASEVSESTRELGVDRQDLPQSLIHFGCTRAGVTNALT